MKKKVPITLTSEEREREREREGGRKETLSFQMSILCLVFQKGGMASHE